MYYSGHIENGVIVLDEPAVLRDGARVRVEIVGDAAPTGQQRPLQGTPYRYDDPFGPAVDIGDWEAAGDSA